MPSLLLPPPVVEHLGPDNGTKIHNGTNHGDLSSMENSWRNHGEFMENSWRIEEFPWGFTVDTCYLMVV